MNIVYASDNNGVDMLAVSIFSIVKNNQNTDLNFYIIDAGIKKSSKEHLKGLAVNESVKIEFLSVDESFFNKITPANNRVPRASYYRYKVPDLLPNQQKVLYLDIDTLCVGSLSGFYDTSLKPYLVGAVEDTFALLPDTEGFKKGIGLEVEDRYVNSGCILMDLEGIRSSGIMQTFWDNVRNRDKLIPSKFNKYNDQTLFNITFKKKIFYAESKYNTLSVTQNDKTIDDDFVILHFAGVEKHILNSKPNLPDSNNDYYYYYHYYYTKCQKLLGGEGVLVPHSVVKTGSQDGSVRMLERILAKQGVVSSLMEDSRDPIDIMKKDIVGAVSVLNSTTRALIIRMIIKQKRYILEKSIQKSFSSGGEGRVQQLSYFTGRIIRLRLLLLVVRGLSAVVNKTGSILRARKVV